MLLVLYTYLSYSILKEFRKNIHHEKQNTCSIRPFMLYLLQEENPFGRFERNPVIMDKYDHNAHSVFLLYYHLILVVKYRRKVFDEDISERAKEIFSYIAPNYGITLEEWNHDSDHVHVMFRGQPKSEISRFINAYKSASSRLLKKEFPEIREKLWKETFWSQSFCLLTAGGAPVETIRQYIETQGEK